MNCVADLLWRSFYLRRSSLTIVAVNLFFYNKGRSPSNGKLSDFSIYIDNLETQKKSISMKNSQFFDYLLYAKSK
jgi:hypothetical protein